MRSFDSKVRIRSLSLRTRRPPRFLTWSLRDHIVEFVFFLFDLGPSFLEDILHRSAWMFRQLFIEVGTSSESLTEGGNGSAHVAVWDRHLLLAESCHEPSKRLAGALNDRIEIIQLLLDLSVARELFNEDVVELCEAGDGVVGKIGIPLQSWFG